MADMQSKSRWIARRGLLRTVALAVGALLCLVLVPVATAAAAISITEPVEGETVGPQPTFGGTDEVLVPVTVHIYKGSTTSGSLVETLGPSEPPLLGKWSLTDETRLAAGTYTATAEQPESLLEPGPSEPVTFTVNTKPPKVTLEKLRRALERIQADLRRDGERTGDGHRPRPRRDGERGTGRDDPDGDRFRNGGMVGDGLVAAP